MQIEKLEMMIATSHNLISIGHASVQKWSIVLNLDYLNYIHTRYAYRFRNLISYKHGSCKWDEVNSKRHTYCVSGTHKNGEVCRVIILAYGGYICVTG